MATTLNYRRTFDGSTDVAIPELSGGQRLRLAREMRDISPAEMSDVLGITERTLSRWENDWTNPNRAALHLAAVRCNVPVFWMLNIKPADDPWRLPVLADGTTYEPADMDEMIELVLAPDLPEPGLSEFEAKARYKAGSSGSGGGGSLPTGR